MCLLLFVYCCNLMCSTLQNVALYYIIILIWYQIVFFHHLWWMHFNTIEVLSKIIRVVFTVVFFIKMKRYLLSQKVHRTNDFNLSCSLNFGLSTYETIYFFVDVMFVLRYGLLLLLLLFSQHLFIDICNTFTQVFL